MSARFHCPVSAAHDLILRASREPIAVQISVLRHADVGDTVAIRDRVRRALCNDSITEAAVDRILAAHREMQRQRREVA